MVNIGPVPHIRGLSAVSLYHFHGKERISGANVRKNADKSKQFEEK